MYTYSSCQSVPSKQSFLTDGKVQAFVSRFGWVRALTSECDLQCMKVVYGAGGGLNNHERKGEPTSPSLSINAEGTQISQFVCCMNNTVSGTTMVYSSCQSVPSKQSFLTDGKVQAFVSRFPHSTTDEPRLSLSLLLLLTRLLLFSFSRIRHHCGMVHQQCYCTMAHEKPRDSSAVSTRKQ